MAGLDKWTTLQRTTFICLQCRQKFETPRGLNHHISYVCWATISERNYPEEWTPQLRRYVQEAVDPCNLVPAWATWEIIEELKGMIEVNSRVVAGALWHTVELPQHMHPEKLSYADYVRDARPKISQR